MKMQCSFPIKTTREKGSPICPELPDDYALNQGVLDEMRSNVFFPLTYTCETRE